MALKHKAVPAMEMVLNEQITLRDLVNINFETGAI